MFSLVEIIHCFVILAFFFLLIVVRSGIVCDACVLTVVHMQVVYENFE